jgi:hypothetical protein
MKQIIMNVLDDMSESQINLASETARETVSSLISAALKTKGCYTEYDDYELDEQEARASWVCDICGENTFEVDSDYIGSGTNHLGCELEVEKREKNWSQKKHEAKVFDDNDEDVELRNKVFDLQKQTYSEMTSDGLSVAEGLKRAKELSQEALEEELKAQLSEEIVDNKDEKYIYESPDGGKTVYRRKFGEDERELVTNWKEVNKNEG